MKQDLFSIVVSLCLLNIQAKGQNFVWAKTSNVTQYTNQSYTYVSGNRLDHLGNLYVAGNYEDCSIAFGSDTLHPIPVGINSFIVKYDTNGNVLYAKAAYGDGSSTTGLAVDKLNDLLVTGTFYSNYMSFNGDTVHHDTHVDNFYIYKFDSAGNVLWSKASDGVSSDIETDNVGNIYVAGIFTTRSVSFGPYTLNNSSPTYWNIVPGDTVYASDIFIVKYDPNGDVIWAKKAGGNNNDETAAITLDGAGNLFLSGRYSSATIAFDSDTLFNSNGNSSHPNVYIAKFDSVGALAWAKNIGCPADLYARAIVADSSGSVYLTGDYANVLYIGTDTLQPDSPGYALNGYFVRYDDAGNVKWAHQFGSAGVDEGSALSVSPTTGMIYLAGGFSSAFIVLGADTLYSMSQCPGCNTTFVATYDSLGNKYCNREFFMGNYYCTGIAVDYDKNIYLSGAFDAYIISGNDTLYNQAASSAYSGKLNDCGPQLFPNNVGNIANAVAIGIYPNPSRGMFMVSATEAGVLRVFNLQGQVISQYKIGKGYTALQVPLGLAAGVYILRYYSGDGDNSVVMRFVYEP